MAKGSVGTSDTPLTCCFAVGTTGWLYRFYRAHPQTNLDAVTLGPENAARRSRIRCAG